VVSDADGNPLGLVLSVSLQVGSVAWLDPDGRIVNASLATGALSPPTVFAVAFLYTDDACTAAVLSDPPQEQVVFSIVDTGGHILPELWQATGAHVEHAPFSLDGDGHCQLSDRTDVRVATASPVDLPAPRGPLHLSFLQ
jgi:hypothetical protein